VSVEAASEAVIWHDAECGAYEADLPLWSEMAARADGPLLELGCGTGRVTMHLARIDFRVTAIDDSAELTGELRRRAADAAVNLRVETVDASSFDLGERFGLVIAPMQLIQLLDGPQARIRCLRAAAAHLAPGGRLALAIVEDPPVGVPESPPLPDVREIDGWVYSSLPLGVRVEDDSLIVERLRQTVAPGGGLREARSLDRLRIIDAEQLEDEAQDAGLKPLARLAVEPTQAHIGSTVVVLEAHE
jgi:SAM-dependent methyltransferase